MDRRPRNAEARLGALSGALDRIRAAAASRTALAALPHRAEINRHLSVVAALIDSDDLADRRSVSLAALRAHALLPAPGVPGHPDAALLNHIAGLEAEAGECDEQWWEAIRSGALGPDLAR